MINYFVERIKRRERDGEEKEGEEGEVLVVEVMVEEVGEKGDVLVVEVILEEEGEKDEAEGEEEKKLSSGEVETKPLSRCSNENGRRKKRI